MLHIYRTSSIPQTPSFSPFSSMKSLPSDTTTEIIARLHEGQSHRQIHQATGVGLATITRLRSLHCPTLLKSSGGRPKKLSSHAIRSLVRSVTTGSTPTAAQATREYQATTGESVHPNTVRRELKKAGLRAVHKQKKPLLKPRHKKARLDFGLITQHWTLEDWKKVIWSDETKINLFGSDGPNWGWKRQGKARPEHLIQPTLKYGGGHIMIWGCMGWDGIGNCCRIDGAMDSALYVQILEEDLQGSLEFWGKEVSEIIFQHDNDPKHTSKMATKWLEMHGYRVLTWPAQSPDLNPIEHLWKYIKDRLGEYRKPACSMHELWERVEREWEKIPRDYVQKLIESMPKRVAEVLKAKGGHIDY